MASRLITWLEPLYLLAIAPLLLFPTVRPIWTAAALALLALVWLLRAFLRREVWPVTPFNPALLLFCLSVPPAVWASAFPELTLPKLTGLILGLAAFRATGFLATTPRGLTVILTVFGLLGAGMWAVGLLGIQLPILAPLVHRLPSALVSLPGAPEQGINPNQLAGVLALYLPFVLTWLLVCLRRRQIVWAVLFGLVALAGAATLLVTRSRAGIVGIAAAVTALVIVSVYREGSLRQKRWVVVAALVTVTAGLVAGGVFLPAWLAGTVASSQVEAPLGDALRQLSLEGRVEIWSRALYALQDFPFTGVGLGTFRRVVNLLYPLFLIPADIDIAHAHNIFLQVGVDLGLGGLVAYGALLLVAGAVAWQAMRGEDRMRGHIALGLLVALIGLHVYGLADALALGSKPGLAFWLALGVLGALAQLPSKQHRDKAPNSGVV